MKKKGAAKPMLMAVIELIIGILIVLALIPLVSFIYTAFFAPDEICENKAEWDSISAALKNLESGQASAEIPFYNSNCNLVSFSAEYLSTEIAPADVIPGKKPQLCLGLVDKGLIKSPEFNKYKCYTLTAFSQINSQQFSTHNYKNHVFLKFENDGKILRITPYGSPNAEFYEFAPKIKNNVPQFSSVRLLIKTEEKLQNPVAFFEQAEKSFPIPLPSLNLDPALYFTIKISDENEEIDYSKISSMSIYIAPAENYLSSLPEDSQFYAYSRTPGAIDESKIEHLGMEYKIPDRSAFSRNWAVSYR